MTSNKIIANQLAMLPGFENHHPLINPELGTGMLNSLCELRHAVVEQCGYASISFSSLGIDTGLFSVIAMIKAWQMQESKTAKTEFVLIGDATRFEYVRRQIDLDLIVPARKIKSIDRAWARFNCGDNTAAVFLIPPVEVDISISDLRWIADRVHYCGGLIVGDSNICRLMKQSGVAAAEIVDIFLLDLCQLFELSTATSTADCFALAACEQLSPFLPVPRLVLQDSVVRWSNDDDYPLSVGRTSAFGSNNFALLSLAIELQLHLNGADADT
jgi:glycine dehydrogenase subunit 2